MKEKHPYDSYFHILEPALESKVGEFTVLGYGTIKKQDLWDYLTGKVWRKPKEGIRIHEMVSDIFAAKIGDYMNYATVEAYKSPNVFIELDHEELEELLGK